MFITDTRKLQRRIVLNDIKGMMFYFQNQKYNSISVETEKEIVSIQTNLPEINKRILKDLKAKLEQLEELVVQYDHQQLVPESHTGDASLSDPIEAQEQLDQKAEVSDEEREEHKEMQFESDQNQLQDWTLTWETIPDHIN